MPGLWGAAGGGGWTQGLPHVGASPRPHAAPPSAHCIVLLLESLLFGAFVTVVFYDQVSGG